MARNIGERKLTAIMSVDVAGYSRMMGVDETGTLASLNALYQNVFAPQVTSHQGSIVKLLGDGALVTFDSIINAVNCAIALQDVLSNQSDLPNIALRIGVNLGDVILEDHDIFGDGVNVAVRIQEIAEPGEVWISAGVYEQIKGKSEQLFHDLGYRKVKNIQEPVHVYRTGTEHPEDGPDIGWRTSLKKRTPLVTGRCMCGDVSYESSEPPTWVGFCHCRMCQRANSAAVSVWAVFPQLAVRFPDKEPTYFQSSPFAERGFCPTCGSPMTMRYPEEPDGILGLYSSTLDHPEDFPPTVHLGVESMMPWLDINDGLPRAKSEESQNLCERWRKAGYPDPADWKFRK